MIGKGRLSELYTIYVKRERVARQFHVADKNPAELRYAGIIASQKRRCVELMYRSWGDENDDQQESALTVGERNR